MRLIAAVGGRRRDELAARHAAWRGGGGSPPRHAVCRHDPAWPPALHAPLAPHALHLSAPAAGLAEPAARPCVALVGTSRPSDYGRAMAGHLARRLSLAGITVIAALREGVAAAAHRGVLDAGGAPFALLDHGRGRATGAALRALRQAVETAGLLAAELPGGADGRCWGARAADRTALTLAAAVVLVEDEVEGPASFAAELARQQGRPVGAVPGPVTSRLSAGPNALIAAGAALLADAADVLDLLALPVPPHSSEGPAPAAHAATGGHTGLEPPLLALLERIGAGTDTAEALLGGETGRDETVALLAEVELLGLVTRTRAGR